MKLRTLIVAFVLLVGVSNVTQARMNRQGRAGAGIGAGQAASQQTCIYNNAQMRGRNRQGAGIGQNCIRQGGNGQCIYGQNGNGQGRGQGGNGNGRNGQRGNRQGGNGQGRGQGGNGRGYYCNGTGVCIYQQ